MTQTIKATFGTEDLDGQMKVFNAQTGAALSLKHLDSSQPVTVTDIYQYSDHVAEYDKEMAITVLYTKEHGAVSTISSTITDTASKLIDLMNNMKLDEVVVKVVKSTSGKGNEFFNLAVIS